MTVKSGVTNEIGGIDFTKLTQVEKSPLACYNKQDGETECVAEVKTSLDYYDEDCSAVKQLTSVPLNEYFWVGHKIDSPEFANWTLDVKVNSAHYTGIGFSAPAKIDSVNWANDLLCFKFKASVVQEDVSITIKSYVIDPEGNRRLLQDADTPFSSATSGKFTIEGEGNDDEGNNGYLVGIFALAMMAFML